jgi:hypothetical protein
MLLVILYSILQHVVQSLKCEQSFTVYCVRLRCNTVICQMVAST